GYCWLVEGADAPDESVERLGILAEVDDGFRLAEIDLATRGPGELLGWKQAGRLGPFAAWGGRTADKLAQVAERAARVAEFLLEEAT
ncbi:ATP-dependent DNA helicase RecG, partial [bacterium]|nr:ATP-dependent DNA helicase RecG [bacterium]